MSLQPEDRPGLVALLEAGGDGVEDLGPGDPVSRRGGPENEQLEQGRHVLLISGSLTKKKLWTKPF